MGLGLGVSEGAERKKERKPSGKKEPEKKKPEKLEQSLSPVVVQPLIVEVDHVRRDRVQESPVVRHHNERLLPAGEVLLEPEHGAEVEVVGRLRF